MRMVLGWLIAAVVMFLIGFGFYGSPLAGYAVSKADSATGASIQAALRALPRDGFYVIPDPETAADAAGMLAGPVSMIHVGLAARPAFDMTTLAKGFAHYLIVAAMLGLVLGAIPRGLRTRAALGIAAIAVVYIHLGGAIWWSYNWRTMGFFAVSDFVSLAVGGLVMAYWLRRRT